MKKTESGGMDYKLSGKLYCGECGSAMHGKCATSKTGDRHYYYECRGNYLEKTCNRKRVKKDWIEDSIINLVSQIITDDIIDKLADAAVAQNEKDIEDQTNIKRLRKTIADEKRKMNNLINIVSSGADPEFIVPAINDMSSRIKDMERSLAEEEAQIIVVTKEQCVYFLRQFLSGDIEDEEFRNNIFKILIQKVTIWEKENDLCKVAIQLNAINKGSALVGEGSHMTPLMEHKYLYTNYLGLSFTLCSALRAS